MNLVMLLMFLFQAHFQPKSPMDVPPITEEYGNPGYEFCDYMGTTSCIWIDAQPGEPIPGFDHTDTSHTLKRRTRFTCADKTRFLMTSEDGKKHCIRLTN